MYSAVNITRCSGGRQLRPMNEQASARVRRLVAWLHKNRRDLTENGKPSPTKIAAETGRKVSYWSDVLRGDAKSFGAVAARAVEDALQIPPFSLEGIDIGQHPSRGVDHQKTQPAHTVTPSIEWRTIVGSEKLPEQFTTTVPDGAMGARVRAGTACIFRTDTVPRFGDGVLVTDKHGELHFRLYAQGDRPGHWRAKADDNRAYRDLDSDDDALTVVAVFHGVMGRWSE